MAKRVASRASERRLLLPSWCVDLLKARRVRLGAFDGPVFADSNGGWRDRSNVDKAIRSVRDHVRLPSPHSSPVTASGHSAEVRGCDD